MKPLTREQLKRKHFEQMRVVERLEELLAMPEVKDMIRETTIAGNLLLGKGGLYVFHHGFRASDLGDWHNESYEKVQPMRELVEKYDLDVEYIERIKRQIE